HPHVCHFTTRGLDVGVDGDDAPGKARAFGGEAHGAADQAATDDAELCHAHDLPALARARAAGQAGSPIRMRLDLSSSLRWSRACGRVILSVLRRGRVEEECRK